MLLLPPARFLFFFVEPRAEGWDVEHRVNAKRSNRSLLSHALPAYGEIWSQMTRNARSKLGLIETLVNSNPGSSLLYSFSQNRVLFHVVFVSVSPTSESQGATRNQAWRRLLPHALPTHAEIRLNDARYAVRKHTPGKLLRMGLCIILGATLVVHKSITAVIGKVFKVAKGIQYYRPAERVLMTAGRVVSAL